VTHIIKAPEDCEWEKVALTVLVLLVLEKKYADKAEVWSLLATKAKDWIKKALGGATTYADIHPCVRDMVE
jgi:hypothetical protein